MCQFAGTALETLIKRGRESLCFFTLKSKKAVRCSRNRNENGTREAVRYVWICRNLARKELKDMARHQDNHHCSKTKEGIAYIVN